MPGQTWRHFCGRRAATGGKDRGRPARTMARTPADSSPRSAVSRRAFIRRAVLLGGGGLVGAAGVGTACSDEPGRERRSAAASGATLDVRDFGAAGDGETDDAGALQRAIDAGAGRGGATVRLLPGTWRSGTLRLRSRGHPRAGRGVRAAR